MGHKLRNDNAENATEIMVGGSRGLLTCKFQNSIIVMAFYNYVSGVIWKITSDNMACTS